MAQQSGSSHVIIGKYERGDAVPSQEVAKKIADAFDVTLDYLVNETAGTFDKKTVQRIQELQTLPEEEQRHVFAMVDAFLRDARARVAYAN